MRVLLLVDHKWRDLPGAAWLALAGERRGHRVRLVRNGFHWETAWRLRPDVVVVNHLLEAPHRQQMMALAQLGVDTVVLPTEGIPTLTGVRDLHAGVGADYSSVARFCAWNQPMHDRMVELGVMPAERIPVVGVPRFDLYRPPLDRLLPDRRSVCQTFGLDPNRPVVVWATNFPAAGSWERDPYFYRHDWRRLGLDRTLGDCETFCLADIRCRDASLAAVCSLVERMPAVQVLVKPHPGDDLGWFRKHMAGFPTGRAALVEQAYIWEVLPAADVLVKRSCTTGVEAWILGQRTIELQPDPAMHYYSPEHAAGSHMATDADALVRLVTAAIAGEPESQSVLAARQAFISRWCFRADGRSTERFLDVLDGLAAERAAAGRSPAAPDRCAFQAPIMRVMRQAVLSFHDYRLHDRRLYGRSGLDRLGRLDKWHRDRDAEPWFDRMDPLFA